MPAAVTGLAPGVAPAARVTPVLEAPVPRRPPRPRRAARGRPGLWLAVLMVSALAAVVSVVVHAWFFASGSLDNDEVAYLMQARAIAHGHLFLPVPQPASAYQPWFFAATEHGYVSKYLPLVPAVLALSLLLTGSVAPVTALLAAVVVPLVAALAREVGLSRRTTLAAAVLVSASPVVVVQSGLALSYLLFLVLVLACWLLLLRLAGGAAGWRAALGVGLLASAAGWCRPYDTVLLLLVPAVAVLRRLRAQPRRLAVHAAAAGAGAAPLLAAVLAYDRLATGSALRLPFGLLEPADTIGFGTRRLVPQDPDRHFGVTDGLAGLLQHFGRLPLTWFALGVLLIPAAVLGARRAAPATRLLLGAAGTLVAGYLAFWGPWNATVLWGGTRVIGPFYALPLLVPVVLAGLPVLQSRARQHPRAVAAALGVALAVGVAQLGVSLVRAHRDAGRTAQVLAAVRAAPAGQVLIAADPPYLGHPVGALVNEPGPGGTGQRYALAAAYPVPVLGSPLPALLQLPDDVYSGDRLALSLTRTVRVDGERVPLAVTFVDDPARRTRAEGGTGRAAAAAPARDPRLEPRDVLVVERAGRTSACRLDPAPTPVGAGPRSVALTVTAAGVEGCSGARVPRVWSKDRTRQCTDTNCLVVAVFRTDASGRGLRQQWRRLPVSTTGGRVALLADGDVLSRSGTGWVEVTAPGR